MVNFSEISTGQTLHNHFNLLLCMCVFVYALRHYLVMFRVGTFCVFFPWKHDMFSYLKVHSFDEFGSYTLKISVGAVIY